jgi:hypothetical protein
MDDVYLVASQGWPTGMIGRCLGHNLGLGAQAREPLWIDEQKRPQASIYYEPELQWTRFGASRVREYAEIRQRSNNRKDDEKGISTVDQCTGTCQYVHIYNHFGDRVHGISILGCHAPPA